MRRKYAIINSIYSIDFYEKLVEFRALGIYQ